MLCAVTGYKRACYRKALVVSLNRKTLTLTSVMETDSRGHWPLSWKQKHVDIDLCHGNRNTLTLTSVMETATCGHWPPSWKQKHVDIDIWHGNRNTWT